MYHTRGISVGICYFRYEYIYGLLEPKLHSISRTSRQGVELGWGLGAAAGPLRSHVYWYCRDKAAVAVNITVAVSRGAWRSVVG